MGPSPLGRGAVASRVPATEEPNTGGPVTTLRDEDIVTSPTATLPGGDADQGDSGETQVDPAGSDPAGSDPAGS